MVKRTTEDAVFSDLVRTRDHWTCQACGTTDGQLDCAHIVSRKIKRLRHDTRNAICLCRVCHSKLGDRPAEFGALCRRILGEPLLDELHRLSHTQFKVGKGYKQELRAHLRGQLARVKVAREQNYTQTPDIVEFN